MLRGEDAEGEVAVGDRFSGASDELDHFACTKAPGDTGRDAEHRNTTAVTCGEIGECALEAGCFAGKHGEDVAVAVLSASVDHRRQGADAVAVAEQPASERVAAFDDDLIAAEKVVDVVFVHASVDRVDGDRTIESGQAVACGFGLVPADVGLGVENLAIEVT